MGGRGGRGRTSRGGCVTLGDCLSCLVSSAVFARNVQTRARGSETRQPVRKSRIATNDRRAHGTYIAGARAFLLHFILGMPVFTDRAFTRLVQMAAYAGSGPVIWVSDSRVSSQGNMSRC